MEFWLSLKVLFGRGFDVHPRLQSAGHDLPHRRLLQAVRQEVRLRPPRHQPRALRGQVRQARLRASKLLVALERMTLQHRRHGDLDQRVVSQHRDRARRQESRATCSSCAPGPDLTRMQAGAAESRAQEGPQVSGRLRRRHGQAGRHRPAAAGRAAHRACTWGAPTSSSASSAAAPSCPRCASSRRSSASPTT